MRFEKASVLIQLARLLAGTAEGMTFDEIAAAYSVSRRTAERLKAAVEVIFPQLETLTDGHKSRFRIAGGLDRFLQAPTSDELAELSAAIKALKQTNSSDRAALLVSLGQKIEAALRPAEKRKLAPDIDALTTATGYITQVGPQLLVNPQILELVRTALKGGNLLTFTYGNNANSRRVVSPWGILYGRAYYLVGPAEGKDLPALWRFDKIYSLEINGQASLPPAEWSLSDFAARSFGVFQEEPQHITLRFTPEAASDASRFLFHHTQILLPQPDGSLIVKFTAGSSLEMANHLFTWGTAVEILEPKSLRKELCEMLAAALSHHKKAPRYPTSTNHDHF